MIHLARSSLQSRSILINDVTLRDGLQGLPYTLPTANKVQVVHSLMQAGVRSIELGSFVNYKIIRNMADTAEVLKHVKRNENVAYWTLVANQKGLEEAIHANVKNIALVTSASNSFAKKNINRTIDESIALFKEMIERAKKIDQEIRFRGYISCCPECPLEGSITVEKIAQVADQLFKIGCDEIVPSDTIGKGTPEKIGAIIKQIKTRGVLLDKIALHLHGEEEQVLQNVEAGLEEGVSIFDSSLGELGGCPAAKGAKGNIATEKLVSFLHRKDYFTGIDLEQLNEVKTMIMKNLKEII